MFERNHGEKNKVVTVSLTISAQDLETVTRLASKDGQTVVDFINGAIRHAASAAMLADIASSTNMSAFDGTMETGRDSGSPAKPGVITSIAEIRARRNAPRQT